MRSGGRWSLRAPPDGRPACAGSCAAYQTVAAQVKNLTAFEKATGWRYSVIVTNIPDAGIPGVPGSHHPQLIDVLHREHAIVEDRVRTAKAMGLRNLPSKTWQVNCGWVAAANIAADLSAWCRLLGLYDTTTSRTPTRTRCATGCWAPPARLVRHARTRVLKISRTWPWKGAFLACWQRLCACPTGLTSHPVPRPGKEPPRRGRSRAARAHRAAPLPTGTCEPDTTVETGTTQSVTSPARTWNHRG